MAIEEKILQAVYDTSLDAIIVIDDKGMIQFFNRIAEKLFNFATSEVLGQNIKMLMPSYFAEYHDGYIERYLRTGEKRIIGIGRVVTGQKKDGSTFPLELAIGEAKIGDRRFFAGFIHEPLLSPGGQPYVQLAIEQDAVETPYLQIGDFEQIDVGQLVKDNNLIEAIDKFWCKSLFDSGHHLLVATLPRDICVALKSDRRIFLDDASAEV